ncbi:MAG: transaldolase [Syntrophobacteraceae bacterium]
MSENPLRRLQAFGQSVWLDYIDLRLIESGGLQRLIDEDGLRGVTTNPSIFDKAVEGSDAYDDSIRQAAREGMSVEEICRLITTEDVRKAADLFKPVYDELDGRDGFVSLEVNPHLAHDLSGTMDEAPMLWAALHRPNVFIKVPATVEGLQCIRKLTADGINVNVTLLFGLKRYRMVADAYISGLEDRAAAGLPIDRVASVASFFLSRIDVRIDELLEKFIPRGEKLAWRLRGRSAIACAKIAYRAYREIFEGERFQSLARMGARTQRVLWASTSTKNPEYSDTKYVEALIGPDTINTMPVETLDAYRDHGDPAFRLGQDIDEARDTLDRLAELGIDMDKIAGQLEEEGIEKFNKPYDSLMASLEKKRRASCLSEAC